MKRGRKKKLAISLMDYMGKRRDMKRQLKKEGTAELSSGVSPQYLFMFSSA